MNRLGILVDITHGTDEAQKQMIEASKGPVVCSHVSIKAVSGVGMSDEVLKLLASKGGVVGIHGGAAVVGKGFRKWPMQRVPLSPKTWCGKPRRYGESSPVRLKSEARYGVMLVTSWGF
jgi:microsomal dipeptidase-like Zn-dependent dipeptidase